jgi:hypothetical protein
VAVVPPAAARKRRRAGWAGRRAAWRVMGGLPFVGCGGSFRARRVLMGPVTGLHVRRGVQYLERGRRPSMA